MMTGKQMLNLGKDIEQTDAFFFGKDEKFLFDFPVKSALPWFDKEKKFQDQLEHLFKVVQVWDDLEEIALVKRGFISSVLFDGLHLLV